jgi:hypothetical protein
MPVRRALVVGTAALVGLLMGQFIHSGGAVLLAVVLGLVAWWLSGRYWSDLFER